MSARRIVVLGASGFVGTTLVEHLWTRPGLEVVPVIHSAGSAWRLARRGVALPQLDITDAAAVRLQVRGATHVVNCTRGPREVMLDGLRNTLDACRKEGVSRFVHLSSVLVYGDPPRPESEHEEARPDPEPGADSYALMKFQQDEMIEEAAKSGLPSLVLCPPNISGPFSSYVVEIVNALRNGSFALLDGGATPCNLVDVRNLCHAIELALDVESEAADGSRIFITDGGEVTWRDLVSELLELSGSDRVEAIERPELERLAGRQNAPRRPRLGAALKHLVSSDVRMALRKDPLLETADRSLRGLVARLGPRLEARLRIGIEGPAPVRSANARASLATRLCAQQLRAVRHRVDRAGRLLGYRAPISFRQSMQDFREWYAETHGMKSPFWPLVQYLYGRPGLRRAQRRAT